MFSVASITTGHFSLPLHHKRSLLSSRSYLHRHSPITNLLHNISTPETTPRIWDIRNIKRPANFETAGAYRYITTFTSTDCPSIGEKKEITKFEAVAKTPKVSAANAPTSSWAIFYKSYAKSPLYKRNKPRTILNVGNTVLVRYPKQRIGDPFARKERGQVANKGVGADAASKPDGLGDVEIKARLSDRFQVIGATAQARYLVHALASTPRRPQPNLLVRHAGLQRRWGEEDRAITLYNPQGKLVSTAEVPCPELIFDNRKRYRAPEDMDFLDNVILDTSSAAIIPSVRRLSHRIDGRTTICIMHPGLGIAEALDAIVFRERDIVDKPNFVLGHGCYQVSHMTPKSYSIQEKRGGNLYLCSLSKSKFGNADPAFQRESDLYTQHMIGLLKSTSGLSAIGLPYRRFMMWKIHGLVFSSLADTISVILGCRYNQIRFNTYAQEIWNRLLTETVAIVSAMPELERAPHTVEFFQSKSFKRKLRMYLVAQGTNISPWIHEVRIGNYPPIDYFNGYLIRRAKELGLDHKHNSLALSLVKSRANARRADLRNNVPLGATPYMCDTDYIGGGQIPDTDRWDGLENM
ncbi:hypothetical protein GGS21DRAFT_521421 [Xylaria nigripes]|nr:hypothetical protein GGS21DRAFT_521421 [Xylaria nigripes]